MTKYGAYSHITVNLAEVLEDIDELLDTGQRALYRDSSCETEVKLSQLVGKLQGINQTMKRIESRFGVQHSD